MSYSIMITVKSQSERQSHGKNKCGKKVLLWGNMEKNVELQGSIPVFISGAGTVDPVYLLPYVWGANCI